MIEHAIAVVDEWSIACGNGQHADTCRHCAEARMCKPFAMTDFILLDRNEKVCAISSRWMRGRAAKAMIGRLTVTLAKQAITSTTFAHSSHHV